MHAPDIETYSLQTKFSFVRFSDLSVFVHLAMKMIILRRYFFFFWDFFFFFTIQWNLLRYSFDVTFIFHVDRYREKLFEDLAKTGEAFGTLWYSLIFIFTVKALSTFRLV